MLKEASRFIPMRLNSAWDGLRTFSREEYAWARRAFDRALVLDQGHEDALVGLGETLLRFGERDAALALFERVAALGFEDDVELMLTMGRALYRESLYAESRDVFAKAAAARPDSAEVAASLGYALHRLGEEVGAGRQIRRSLRLDPDLHEARIYLGISCMIAETGMEHSVSSSGSRHSITGTHWRCGVSSSSNEHSGTWKTGT